MTEGFESSRAVGCRLRRDTDTLPDAFVLMRRLPSPLAAVVLAVFGAGYALQPATPLRLTWDVATYLTLAGSLLDGRGLADPMVTPVYPPGYPLLVALVARLGLNVSTALVALNVAAVTAATVATSSLSRGAFRQSARASCVVAALVPSSYFVAKYTVSLVADVTFMGVATLAVLALTRAVERPSHAARFLTAAALLIAMAFFLRSSAVALVPALAVTAALVWRKPVTWVADRVRAHRVAWSIVTLAALALSVGWVLTDTQYGRDARSVYEEWGADVLVNNIRWKLLEGGEIMLNAPEGRLSQRGLPIEVLRITGCLGIILLVASAWSLRQRPVAWPALTYLAAFVAMLVLWPGYDPRFWLGVWPVALATVVAAVSGWNRLAVRVAQAWSAAFVSVALVALVLSVRISLAGPDFPERYSNTLFPIYRASWTGSPPPDSSILGLRYYHVLSRFSPPE